MAKKHQPQAQTPKLVARRAYRLYISGTTVYAAHAHRC